MPSEKLEISPKEWGPKMWYSIHCIAKFYPCKPDASKKQSALMFFESLEDMLPCKKCRENYASYIKEHPPALSSRAALTRWTWNLHDHVNQRLGKKSTPFREVYRC
jgi:FAD-linked sulfhydryl oxidase